MGKGFLNKQQAIIDTYRKAERETYVQFMTDLIIITLNDERIMGHDTFGAKRIAKVLNGISENYKKFHTMLERHVEADYFQVKMDEAIENVLGDALPFEERYPWLKKQRY